ncbi:Potassium transporter 5 [Platanthera zijinensis]|uniref:Potassium transporter n=1 Tax=Platanthera zijinensis TaxID=2320716 RepID=A0AAP0B5N3_9ASPA
MLDGGEADECADELDAASSPDEGSHRKITRHESLDIEATAAPPRNYSHEKDTGAATMLRLAFQSIGVVYGDIGTSPLYVFASTFTGGIAHEDDVIGVLSLIFYTITLVPLIKYVFIVLRANDNGYGGTFAMYSLICRYAKVGLMPSQQAEDGEVSNFRLQLPSRRLRRATGVKEVLEKSSFAKHFLLIATMLGTAMVIGDGILTPCISVLSAVGGLKNATDAMTEERIAWISVAILVILFGVQSLGTDKVGYSFAPIITSWFLSIGSIGVFNLIKYDPKVLKAVNPNYIVDYFLRNGKEAWISLGAVVLCITGVEALFADVGHFTVRSIQLSMCVVAFPSLMLAYAGQASYLRKHPENVAETFYKSIPGGVYWPMFVLALLSAIIASQAMISGTFSIVQQSLSLGCFPRVKIVHTSSKLEGQVYIPEMNYFLMLACVVVTAFFKSTVKIGNAYGIAVVLVMALTSGFLVLIMIMIWKTHILLVLSYTAVIGAVELLYLSSVLYKFDQGGYLPLSFAALLISLMLLWNYVHRKRYAYELHHKFPAEKLLEINADPKFLRIPGLALFFSDLAHGIPPIFHHYLANIPALHSALVFVSIKTLPIGRVPPGERFLFRRLGPGDMLVFHCAARYGYGDARGEREAFDEILVRGLKEFLLEEGAGEEIGAAVEREWRAGVVHLLGETEVVAGEGSGLLKRLAIDYAFNLLKRNLRREEEVLPIPRRQLLKVGMTMEL